MRESDRLTSRMHLLKKFGLSRVARTKNGRFKMCARKKVKACPVQKSALSSAMECSVHTSFPECQINNKIINSQPNKIGG